VVRVAFDFIGEIGSQGMIVRAADPNSRAFPAAGGGCAPYASHTGPQQPLRIAALIEPDKKVKTAREF